MAMAISTQIQFGHRVQPGGSPGSLGQILAGGDAQAGRDHLEDDRHQARQGDDPEQGILELRPRPARSVPQLPGSM